ncbi:MAG: ribosome silencing factor [Alphaproteobacteria bacterium]|nr:ribosome silencing factor [Alphaproteobacteria bacterium]
MTPKKLTIKTLLNKINKKLDAGKAEDIRILDIRPLSSFADYMIIATGTSTRHVLSLAHHLIEDLKQNGYPPFNNDTPGDGTWAVVDLGNILIHIFTAEARNLYNLEGLWSVQPKSKRTRTKRQKSA